jgi:hypothetical protein
MILTTTILATVLSLAPSTHPVETKQNLNVRNKTICRDVVGKNGKPVVDAKTKKIKQHCKTIKVRDKLNGTKVPTK